MIGAAVHLERHVPVASGFERGPDRFCAFAWRHALVMRAIDEQHRSFDLSPILRRPEGGHLLRNQPIGIPKWRRSEIPIATLELRGHRNQRSSNLTAISDIDERANVTLCIGALVGR